MEDKKTTESKDKKPEVKKDQVKEKVSSPAKDNNVSKAEGFTKAPAGKRGGFRKPSRKRRMTEKPKDEFEQKVLDLARVTRVMAGGKRMKFRATMVVGDKKGKVGIGIAKGADVSIAISKAVSQAKKNLIEVPIVSGTVPHQVRIKDHSAELIIRPAQQGNGIKAGGVMRVIFDLAGIKDVVAKILGTNNKVNNAKATIKALNSFVPEAVEAAKASQKNNKVKKVDHKKSSDKTNKK